MFCSTIIPTIGRSELSRAVNSVLSQGFPSDQFEIIVVNDTGSALIPADWQESPQVKLIATNHRERSIARNTGAAIARGRYLHFLDDDDWLLPGALQTFWELAQRQPDHLWLYGGTQLVDRFGNPLIRLDHQMQGNCFVQVMAGEWIPLQSSTIKSDVFFDIGGFNPLISGPEDVDLCRRVLLHGNLAGTETMVACVGMGTAGSSTDYDRSPHLSRWARETILNETGVFSRLLASASSSYWYGRVVRVYLTSCIWNLQQKNLMMAISRSLFAAIAFFLSGWRISSRSYWKAITQEYQSFTFERGKISADMRTSTGIVGES